MTRIRLDCILLFSFVCKCISFIFLFGTTHSAPSAAPTSHHQHHTLMELVCQHTVCTHSTSTGDRHRFHSYNGRAIHERGTAHHPCPTGECKICKKREGKRREVKRKKGTVPCRHGGCNKQFLSVTTRNEHERLVSHCCVGDCPACKENEERNEQEERNREEQGRKRKEREEETERCCESEEAIIEAIKRQRREAYEEYRLKGVPSKEQQLHELVVVVLKTIYSMPKVLFPCMHKQIIETLKSFIGAMYGAIFGRRSRDGEVPCAAQPSPSAISLTAFS